MAAFQLFISFLFPVAALIVTSAGISLLFRYQTTLARWGAILMLAIGIDLVSYFFVLTGRPTGGSPSSFRFLIVAYLFLVIAWLFFILVFCGYERWINVYSTIGIGSIPLLVGSLVLTHPEIDPIWMSQGGVTVGSLMVLAREFGWLGSLFIVYTFGIGIFSMMLLIQLIPTTSSYFRMTTIMLFAGALVIVCSGLLEVADLNPFVPVASIQLGYALCSVLAFLFVFTLRAGGMLPITRNAAFEHIQDGLLVLDQQDNIVDMNPAAAEIIGQADTSVIGRPISQVWKHGAGLLTGQPGTSTIEGEHTVFSNGLERTIAIKVAPILAINHEKIGRTVVLRNVTGREQMEAALQQQAGELSRTNRLTAALSSAAAQLGNASSTETGFEILGLEMRRLNLDCGVVTIDPSGETATIKYLSFNPVLVKKIERLTGIRAENYEIPRRYWPGNRILEDRGPIWYPNPRDYIRRMFPQIPDMIANKALELLGIVPSSQICILPLLVEEKVIGAMPIWGADLQPSDDPVLSLFARQVAGILHNIIARQSEIRRGNELARSNAMILALSKVATLLGSSSNSQFALDTLGAEIKALGLDCGIVTVDEAAEAATIKYLSFNSVVIRAVENLTGVSAKNYIIPRSHWPDDRVIKEKAPIWYADSPHILRGMFPEIPELVARKSLQLLGFKRETRLCMLPLNSTERTIGVMLIWGTDLHPSDNTVLAIFASQVAGILQTTLDYEMELRRANELARSNAMILALSTVAAQLESSSGFTNIFDTVGKELKKLGLDSIVGILDDSRQNMLIKYVSINREVIRWAEKRIGHSLNELSVPRHLWPTEKVVAEKAPYWDPNHMRGTLNMFPILPESLHKIALKMAGINMNDPVCYLPLANEHDVLGVLAVWGGGLKKSDISALSVLASQVTTAIRNSSLYESESRRAIELGILLEASEATSSSSQLGEVLLSLASKLRELSGFESCYISEWDRETNMITGLIKHARVFWSREKRVCCSLEDYPAVKEVLLTGNPVVLQGDFELHENQWITSPQSAVRIILALKARGETIGLVEIATTQENTVFDPQVLTICQKILENGADSLFQPLSKNDRGVLFFLESELLKASAGEVCSFSEWDQAGNRILAVAVSVDMASAGQSTKRPEEDPSWQMALYEGKASFLVRSKEIRSTETKNYPSLKNNVESTIIFPLRRGGENIGLIELYDYNHRKNTTPDQIALLRTVADKASFSIQNARLLQQTQMRLSEKTALLHEKEVLLKEVHHRVKNNLQIISSLLNLQSTKIFDLDTRNALQESQNRVRTMALIHEKLYQSTNLAEIDFAAYLQSLVNFLAQSYRPRSDNVEIRVAAQQITMDIDAAIPCGLIVNELVSNSLKHAFPDNRKGTIWVELNTSPEDVINLRVADDGAGLPPDLDLLHTKSLGLRLVTSLTSQVDGTLELESSKGVSFRLSFKHRAS